MGLEGAFDILYNLYFNDSEQAISVSNARQIEKFKVL